MHSFAPCAKIILIDLIIKLYASDSLRNKKKGKIIENYIYSII